MFSVRARKDLLQQALPIVDARNRDSFPAIPEYAVRREPSLRHTAGSAISLQSKRGNSLAIRPASEGVHRAGAASYPSRSASACAACCAPRPVTSCAFPGAPTAKRSSRAPTTPQEESEGFGGSPPLSNSRVTPANRALGASLHAPADTNALRVIEIRVAPPDNATVVSGHGDRLPEPLGQRVRRPLCLLIPA